MAHNDMAPNFMVFEGVEGDDGSVTTSLKEWEPKEVKDAITPWTKGTQDTDTGSQEFLMLSPVDECKKGLSTRYHIFVHPFEKSDTHIEDETEFYNAIVFATNLMAKEGRVWTKGLWQKYGDSQDTIENYPLLHEIGFKNPVFCAFQVDGEIYGFALNEDMNSHYSIKKKHHGHLHKRLKMRALYLKQTTAAAKLAFKDKKIDGLKKLHFKKSGFKYFADTADITVDSLKGIIQAAADASYA